MISLRSVIVKKVLNYFFVNPEYPLYLNEISRKFNLDKRNLVKKLNELEKEGILLTSQNGNLKNYSINKSFPLYEEYKKILFKSNGFEEDLRKALTEIKAIKQAYLFGSYAKNNYDMVSDIDLLLIGTHDIIKTQRVINHFQKQLNREINAVNMDEKDYLEKKSKKDPFILQIFKNEYIRLI